ncbi:unnamed protein product, partial [Mesorhabditis belari]|uniref:RING-type domain-containing protein n=1 Tax=Mesorhabditis belari TaxID=2138241 RepID=A0AAF3EXF9_9BILA
MRSNKPIGIANFVDFVNAMFCVTQPLPARYLFGSENPKIPITRLGPPGTAPVTTIVPSGNSTKLQNKQSPSKAALNSLPAPLKLDKSDFIGFLPFHLEKPYDVPSEKSWTPAIRFYRRMVSYAQPCTLCQKAVMPRGLLVVLPCAHILHPECADEMHFNHRPCDRCDEISLKKKGFLYYVFMLFCCL